MLLVIWLPGNDELNAEQSIAVTWPPVVPVEGALIKLLDWVTLPIVLPLIVVEVPEVVCIPTILLEMVGRLLFAVMPPIWLFEIF